MGWVLMSERDVRRIEVLTEILSGPTDGSLGSNRAGDQRPAGASKSADAYSGD